MKLALGDVIKVKEDMQFYYPFFDKIVGEVYKVTTVINENSALVQRCTENGALKDLNTKRVRNPDMDWAEFTDYYKILKTQDSEKLYEEVEDVRIGDTPLSVAAVEDLLGRIEASGVVSGPDWSVTTTAWPWPSPTTTTAHDFENPDEEVGGGIKSDGGSSSYYDIAIPSWLVAKILERAESDEGAYIKTEELIEFVFDNDFDFGNNFKSSVRAMGKMKGAGKAGNTVGYECNKMDYSTNKIRKRDERG